VPTIIRWNILYFERSKGCIAMRKIWSNSYGWKYTYSLWFCELACTAPCFLYRAMSSSRSALSATKGASYMGSLSLPLAFPLVTPFPSIYYKKIPYNGEYITYISLSPNATKALRPIGIHYTQWKNPIPSKNRFESFVMRYFLTLYIFLRLIINSIIVRSLLFLSGS